MPHLETQAGCVDRTISELGDLFCAIYKGPSADQSLQCVIVATRPLLLSVLKERLDKLGQEEEDWESFLAPTKTLISTGIKSAAKTLQILADEDSLLGRRTFDGNFYFLYADVKSRGFLAFPARIYLRGRHLVADGYYPFPSRG